MVLALYLQYICLRCEAHRVLRKGGMSVALPTSPSTSMTVSSQYSSGEIFHFTHTLCIRGFYNSNASFRYSELELDTLPDKRGGLNGSMQHLLEVFL